MRTFNIIPATAVEISAILAMVRELAEFEKMTEMMVSTEEMLHEALFGAQPACECLVGIEDGQPVAFALFYHNYSTFIGRKGLYLEDLYVKPAQRGLGYGRALLVAIAKIALQRGCGRFDWSVLNWNDNAIDFYSGLGAQMLPDWRTCRISGAELEHLAR
jgi:GNAT superfamily N-acetyltransferase